MSFSWVGSYVLLKIKSNDSLRQRLTSSRDKIHENKFGGGGGGGSNLGQTG